MLVEVENILIVFELNNINFIFRSIISNLIIANCGRLKWYCGKVISD